MRWCHTEVGPLESILLRHARDAFESQELTNRTWVEFGFAGPPDVQRAIAEYDRFEEVLTGFGVRIEYLRGEGLGLDSIYTRDASVLCDRGAILCNMGKQLRREEPIAHDRAYAAMGVPVIGAITGDGLLEGGDVVWIGDDTLAVGRGYRTNSEGIRQLRELIGNAAGDVIVVPLPHWRGPGDVFHLMSVLSPIDRDLALVYSPLLSVPFREALLSRSIDLVEVPDEEFGTLGGNVLTVRPRTCIMLDGNPVTRARLEDAGVEVHVVSGTEICMKGAGGPTCLTRPIRRAND